MDEETGFWHIERSVPFGMEESGFWKHVTDLQINCNGISEEEGK